MVRLTFRLQNIIFIIICRLTFVFFLFFIYTTCNYDHFDECLNLDRKNGTAVMNTISDNLRIFWGQGSWRMTKVKLHAH